jgi:hypothetical protein
MKSFDESNDYLLVELSRYLTQDSEKKSVSVSHLKGVL